MSVNHALLPTPAGMQQTVSEISRSCQQSSVCKSPYSHSILGCKKNHLRVFGTDWWFGIGRVQSVTFSSSQTWIFLMRFIWKWFAKIIFFPFTEPIARSKVSRLDVNLSLLYTECSPAFIVPNYSYFWMSFFTGITTMNWFKVWRPLD